MAMNRYTRVYRVGKKKTALPLFYDRPLRSAIAGKCERGRSYMKGCGMRKREREREEEKDRS